MTTIDDILVPPAIAAAADHVARAETDLAEHRRVAAQARAADDQILGRISALDARRAAIGSRRSEGEGRDSDAGELELIRLDRESLEDMRGDASAMVNRTRAAEQQAEQVLAAARQVLTRAETEVEQEELIRHAEKLDAALTETIVELNARTRTLGGLRPAWKPSEALADRLRRLQIGSLT
ncbi:hypothetical protein EJV46_05875 [Roseococcus sp. SYP-B2431]|uniref:hypothetical protein n=1 Tax=Roseococcus sp. SYP-B2431 TaxID=2496640 RepID=UPI00103FA6B4|nr:hypothetical protein [Roseococcus sp. SYP-B2431]TCI00178.1 hypothetical protein EJV46_05875 [Roseococcus sp. SYP-B2431]